MINYNTQDAPSFPVTPEGDHRALITEVDQYNNPSGEDKLIITFSLPDQEGLNHKEFVFPSIMEGDGFCIFSDLLKLLTGKEELEPEGQLNEEDLIGLMCKVRVKQTKGKGKHEGRIFANVQRVLPNETSNPFDKKKVS